MWELVRSSVHAGCAMATVGALLVAPAVLPDRSEAAPSAVGHVRLTAAATPTSTSAPPGALISQFLLNQLENCSLICPFIVQGVIQTPVEFAIIPATFAAELQAGQPLLQAIARTDATVSGAANAALTGIITNDLGLVLPRAQHALEVAVVGLIGIGTTAVTRPGDVLAAIGTARADFLTALAQAPGPAQPAAVHNAVEAAAVRTIEVLSALTFQAPERLLLGVTQAADTLFRTLGATGDVGAALAATGASVATTIRESVDFVRHAVEVPIPVAAAQPATAAVLETAPDPAAMTPSPAATPARRSAIRPPSAPENLEATDDLGATATPDHRRHAAEGVDVTPAATVRATDTGEAGALGHAEDGTVDAHGDGTDRSGTPHREAKGSGDAADGHPSGHRDDDAGAH